MSTESSQQTSKLALEFKTSNFSVPVLVFLTNSLADIDLQLKQKVEKAPDFFTHSPVVLDLQGLNKNGLPIDIEKLITLIRQLKYIPIGIRGGTEEQNATGLKFAVPVFSVHHSVNSDKKTNPTSPRENISQSKPSTTLIHSQPVRSGQRIYSESDLIILAQVSAGAEIIAEGNVHIYSTLRGRVLAGVQGNTNARIFCSDMQAELISIAGTYQVSDNISASKGKPVQIYLEDQTLIIKDI